MEEDALLAIVATSLFVEMTWRRVPIFAIASLIALSFQMEFARWFPFFIS